MSSAQALRALKALQSHRKKYKASQAEKSKEDGKSLLPLDGDDDDEDASESKTDDMVYLNVTVKRLAKEKSSKPVQIPLPHPVNPFKSTAVCLFVKDPQRTYKDLLPTLGISCVHRIVGVSKLKGKFAPFEARRNLMDEYDVFLCDERVSPMMPALLGSKWMAKKKMPINVNVTHTRHLKKSIETAIGSARMIPNRGTCTSVPLGSLTAYSPEEILENLSAALPKVASKIPYEGWKNIQNIEVKTGKSASLPVWSSDLKDRWDGIEDAQPMEGIVIEEEVTSSPTPAAVKKSKKSAAAATEASAAPTPSAKKTKSSTQAEKSSAKSAATGKSAASPAAATKTKAKSSKSKAK